MIAYLNGKIAQKTPEYVILDVGGVGYKVIVSVATIDRLPAVGEEAKIYTYQHVREDAITLYGFSAEDEEGLFEVLLSVSGIGPKTALSITAGMSVASFVEAITLGNIESFSGIPGIGRKTIEKMMVDLKDKVKKIRPLKIADRGAGARAGLFEDAVMALVALGYKQNEAGGAVAKVVSSSDGNLKVEDIVRGALRLLMK
jgi:Holliday junction DNA helicase RuvA